MSSHDSGNASPGSRKQYSAPALEKGLDILELLASESSGLNITEISRRLGRTVGEIFRMVVVLDQRGYVHSPEESDNYSLTMKLFRQAHRIPRIARLGSAAAAVMRNLAYATGQSCHLVVYFAGRGHVVVQQDPPSERILQVRLGAEAPLIDTCSGHILLAFSSDEDRAAMVREIPEFEPKATPPELAVLVARVREQGQEIIPSSQVQGVTDIGFPVFDHTGIIAAALVVPFLAYLDDSHPISFEAVQMETGQSAAAISQALGFRGGSAPNPD